VVSILSSGCSRLPLPRCIDVPLVESAAADRATSTVGSIVYVRHNVYRRGTDLPPAEIRVVSPEGGDDRRLAVGRDVSFDADASVMAVARFGRAVVSTTSGRTLLTVPISKRAQVALSPDGGRLLWWEHALHLVDVATGRDHEVSDRPVGHAAWSPDGSGVVFDRSSAVLLFDVDDGTTRELVRPGRLPEWMGEDLIWYFASGEHVITTEGAEVDAWIPRGLSHPGVAPGGSTVAFSALRWVCGANPTEASAREIWVDMPDLANPVRITDNPGYHLLDTDPAWSPDGRSVAFVRVQNRYIGAIAVVNVDGSGLHVITEGHETTRDPIWVPIEL
jgi:dipeptidyl aminopeptidase/acylaminoacyl peptidase